MRTVDASRDALALVPYDRRFLSLSASWLADPETRALTMTPEFSRDDQERFFASLPNRPDYRIWGLEHAGEPIGAAGVKNIAAGSGEYWGYIGVKPLWGRGLGRGIIGLIEKQARLLDLKELFLRVSKHNPRAVRLYEATGYRAEGEEDGILVMCKKLNI